MSLLGFSRRDAFWLTAVALLTIGWLAHFQQWKNNRARLRTQVDGFRFALQSDGWKIHEEGEDTFGKRPDIVNEHGQWFRNFAFGPTAGLAYGSSVEKPGQDDDSGDWESYPALTPFSPRQK
jgi:hypothetical protein